MNKSGSHTSSLLRGALSPLLLRHAMVVLVAALGFGISGTCFAAANYQAFGVYSKGKKVFFILDAGRAMMVSPSYSVKKEALLSALYKLPATHEFNVAVYSGNDTQILFSDMVPASKENRQKVKAWLNPLNEQTGGASGTYGVETLGEGGKTRDDDVYVGPFDLRTASGERPEEIDRWFRPVMLAIQMKADSIYLLTNEWGHRPVMVPGASSEKWKNSSAEKRWNERLEKANLLLKEENEKRRSKGHPPRVFRDQQQLLDTYFPDLKGPPPDEQHEFSGKEYLQGFLAMRDAGAQDKAAGSRKTKISLNVVVPIPKNGGYKQVCELFKDLTSACNGKLVVLKGEAGLQRHIRNQ